MSVAEIAEGRSLLSIDLGWRNVAFSLRTAAAAVLALALAYWLELSDPQWATLTVYVLAQPTVGGALAKGIWRAVGTLAGASVGLVIVAALSQAAELLALATSLTVAASFYAGARLRNFTSYGVLLGGYTALLVAYEGSSHPDRAWSIAVDRTSEILIGIFCGAAASLIFFPRYANDALRENLRKTLGDLSRYVATALRLSRPMSFFVQMRRQMISEVVSFDALASYAAYEAHHSPSNPHGFERVTREFLVVLSIARAVYFRIDGIEASAAQIVRDQLSPPLEMIAEWTERVGRDPVALADLPSLRRDLIAAQAELAQATAKLESMAGAAPFALLANGLLILNHVRDLLRGLARLILSQAASLDPPPTARAPRRNKQDAQARREALLIGMRAGLAILLLSVLWMATGWNEGFTAVSGGAIMLFFGVNQDNPRKGAQTYLIWSTVGVIVAYLTTILVLPSLQGFASLSIVLFVVLFPAGLMAGTPSYAWAGIALGAFTISEIGTGNVFKPDELSYVNGAVALIVGMLICLAVITAMPVTSLARREESWRRTIGSILPKVARGEIAPRRGASQVVAMLVALLPRLSLDSQADEDLFRGALGASSAAVELGRLRATLSDPAMPQDAGRAIAVFLDRFSSQLEDLGSRRNDRATLVADAAASVEQMQANLSARRLSPGAEARALLRAGASIRFIADRFDIDRAYLARRPDEDRG